MPRFSEVDPNNGFHLPLSILIWLVSEPNLPAGVIAASFFVVSLIAGYLMRSPGCLVDLKADGYGVWTLKCLDPESKGVR